MSDVHGISDAEVRSILTARAEKPFADVGDFMRRANVSRPVVEALAHAGAFDSLPKGTRRDRLYTAMVTESAREGEQLGLDLWGSGGGGAELGSVGHLGGRSTAAAAPSQRTNAWTGFSEYTEAERVRAELEVLEVDASRHLLTFYEPLLEELGVTRSKDLWKLRANQRVLVAGVKVASQTPIVPSRQRIIFLTLDDATGPVDVTVFESVQPRYARTVFHSFVLAVRGTLRRTGVRGVSIIAEDIWDLAELHRQRTAGPDAGSIGQANVRPRPLRAAPEGHPPRGGSAAPELSPPRKMWHASGGSAGW